MSKKEKTTETLAEFRPVGAVADGDTLHVLWDGKVKDSEIGTEAAAMLADEIGATSWTPIEEDESGNMRPGRTYFSSATWKAPWQPKGPKPNWQEKADPTEPIN